jgi:hypothetical protein
MPDAAHLREMAAHMLALAMGTEDQHLLERLCVRAANILTKLACSTPHSVQLLTPIRKPRRSLSERSVLMFF